MRRVISFLIFLLLVALPSGAQVSAWGEADGKLWIVDLPSGEMEAVGPTGVDAFVELAREPDGKLLGLVDVDTGAELYDVDTTSGAATLHVTFDQVGVRGLTVLADGRIFVSAGGGTSTAGSEIFEVNPADGSTRFVVDLAEPIWALADDSLTLIAFVGELFEPSRIFTVDPETGDSLLVNEGTDLTRSPNAAMVSPSGSIWTLESNYLQMIGLFFTPQQIYNHGQGDTSTYEEFFYSIFEPQAQLSSLSWRSDRAPGAVGIPTLGGIGQVILVILLASVGWYGLIRR